MGRALLILPLMLVSLEGCGGLSESEQAEEERLEQNAEPDSFGPDPETGEVRARFTDSEGVTTVMRAGEEVTAPLPQPFLLYPGSRVTGTTFVEQGKDSAVTVDFVTKDPRDAVVEFYRQLARGAKIDPSVDIDGENAATLAGRSGSGRQRFTLHVKRENTITSGQLSVTTGLD